MYHGCLAGKELDALKEIYYLRIHRSELQYNINQLGGIAEDLAALSGLFTVPWSQPSTKLTENAKAAVFNWAGNDLRALGRGREAREAILAGLGISIQLREWQMASEGASNLCGISLIMGEVDKAVAYAQQGVTFSEHADVAHRIILKAVLADALHQKGNFREALSLFLKAEEQQKKRQQYPFLYAAQGFWFCDLLLHLDDYQQVKERASLTIEMAKKNNWIACTALDHLSLGRAALLLALSKEGIGGEMAVCLSPSIDSCKDALLNIEMAVLGLRDAGTLDLLTRGLIARAEYYRVTGEYVMAESDLEETREIAEWGEMKLCLSDYHLEAARLAFAKQEKANSRLHWEAGQEMVKELGYGRRKEDIDRLGEILQITE